MRILLATDGSEFSVKAAMECRRLIADFDEATVKVITVIDNFTPMATEPFISPEEFLASVEKDMQENAERIIYEAEKILKLDNEDLIVEKEILMGSPKKVVVRDAEKWGADLIVVGSHGYGFWSRALLGSVSDSVLHHAPCSVLVVKKQDEKP